jgi:hypothetical protein
VRLIAKDAGPRKDTNAGRFLVDLTPGPDRRGRQAKRRSFKTWAEAQTALDELRVAGRQGAYVPPA